MDLDAINKRRVFLIRKQIYESLSLLEESELARLEAIMDEAAPPAGFSALDELAARARRLGIDLSEG